MWDLQLASPFGRVSKRYILTFVMTLMATCFAYIFAAAPTVHAADAEWSGAAIRYEGNLFTKAADGKDKDPRSIPVGSIVYANISTPSTTGGTANPPQKASFLYFPPSADVTTAVSAQYIIFDYTPPSTYVNPSNVQTVALTNQPSASGGTSCDSKMTWGLGWIICPATRMLAGAMDTLFTVLSSFLTVQPAQTGQTDTLYLAWSFMRNFANIVFAGGFLVIIYSQLTSMGLSSYGVKKILPRLIIAAILVNVSYWVCAVAIDLSNILGYAIQDLFISLRTGLMGAEDGAGWSTGSWESITGFILSAGTVGVVGGIAGVSLLTGVGAGALYLLLPILVGVLMAVLVALLVMAARQAIIIVLVIVSPLAFVAYLLPNTEKYFEKWRSLFTTMLILFPMFSVIFGGSQLAGLAIIKNANSINLVLLGLAVQVAPVVITPLLVKFSGSLVGRIAGVVNNPNKGLIDRTRKFADERRGQHEARRKANADPTTWKGNRIIKSDTKRRTREGWQKTNESLSEARFAQTREYSNMQQASMRATEQKEQGDIDSQVRYNSAKLTDAVSRQRDINVRTSKLRLEESKAEVESKWDELSTTDYVLRELKLSQHHHTNVSTEAKAKWDNDVKEWESGRAPIPYAPGSNMSKLINESRLTAQSIAIQGMRKQQAERAGQIDLADVLKNNNAQLTIAGGIMGEVGRTSVESTAKSIVSKAFMDDVKNIQDTMDYKLKSSLPDLEIAFNTATTMPQRIAYANAIANSGPPGIQKLVDVIKTYEASPHLSGTDLEAFKELLGENGSIRQAGKNFDDWINNSEGLSVNFETITDRISTWNNLSADKFANMNTTIQSHAIDRLTDPVSGDPAAFGKLVDGLRASPETTRLIKPSIRTRLGLD